MTTNVDFLRFLLADDDVAAGRLDTGLLDRRTPSYAGPQADDAEMVAAAAYRWLVAWRSSSDALWGRPSGWRVGEHAPTSYRLRAGERTDHVHLTGVTDGRGRAHLRR